MSTTKKADGAKAPHHPTLGKQRKTSQNITKQPYASAGLLKAAKVLSGCRFLRELMSTTKKADDAQAPHHPTLGKATENKPKQNKSALFFCRPLESSKSLVAF